MRCRVIGPQPVLEKRRGEIVYLDDAHAARLIAAGHVEADPAPPRRPPAPRKPRKPSERAKKPAEPRQDAGLSHVADTAAEAEDSKE